MARAPFPGPRTWGAAVVLALAAADPRAEPRPEPVRLLDLAIDHPAVRRAVEAPTVARALTPTRFIGRREHEDFFLDHLPLSAVLGRRLHPDLEPYQITEKGPGLFEVEEPGRLKGPTRLVAGAEGRRVYLVEGEFRSLAHLLRFTGSMVIALRYFDGVEAGGPVLINEPHLFVRIDNIVVHGLAKLLAPIVNGIIDRRVAALAAAAEAVSRRATTDARGLYGEMRDWPEVTEAQRAAFRRHFGLPDD